MFVVCLILFLLMSYNLFIYFLYFFISYLFSFCFRIFLFFFYFFLFIMLKALSVRAFVQYRGKQMVGGIVFYKHSFLVTNFRCCFSKGSQFKSISILNLE